MLKIILVIAALASSGEPFQAQVPVANMQECIDKGRAWVEQDPATVGAKQLAFVCAVVDERPQA
jgi:hypothetical protein